MALDQPIPPRLTRMELQGFKSFANRTVFVFEDGITAIIGPNGSGKSNISDGLRWVLGETSHGAIRSKRTDDVIFAGGNGRAPVGMAEVSVTFDNTTQWLPIEFAEVTITRRAFRGGENQYFINGRRVRLKDVQQLTAVLGHSHTVVGQGLVDAALSQRPDERRSLFEHAADLAGMQMKMQEAERNLAEAEANAERITDVLREVEPRLKVLGRAAAQAREWRDVQQHLRSLERAFFKVKLADARVAESQASRRVQDTGAAAEAARRELETHAQLVRDQRAQLEHDRTLLQARQAELRGLDDELRRLHHERDLIGERQAALERRAADLAERQDTHHAHFSELEAEHDAAQDEIARAEAERQEIVDDRAAAAELRERARSVHAARRRQIEQVTSSAATLEQRIGDLRREIALLDQDEASASQEIAADGARSASRRQRIDTVTNDIAALEAEEIRAGQEFDQLDVEVKALLQHAEAAAQAEREARERAGAIARDLGEARARHEALLRIQESGAGLYRGVQFVLEAGRTGSLAGVRGTVGALIETPPELETAIEVALGGHLQDVVVETWEHARVAIERLRRDGAGRVTFQPLDTVRAPRIEIPACVRSDAPGLWGVAAQLVRCDAEIRPVVDGVLGRVIVVDDLEIARGLVRQLPGGWSVVTRAGDMARSSGSVTGGSATRSAGILGRERELRELPRRIAELEADAERADTALAELASVPGRLAEERRQLDARRAGLLAARRERAAQLERLRGWASELEREDRQEQDRLARLHARVSDASERRRTLTGQLETAEQDLAGARAAVIHLQERADVEAAELQQAEERCRALDQQLAAIDERIRVERKRLAGLAGQLEAARREHQLRAEREASLVAELETIAQHLHRIAADIMTLTRERDRLQEVVAPIEARLQEASAAAEAAGDQLERSRALVATAEREHHAALLDHERAVGELMRWRQQISRDLELDDPDEVLAYADELPEAEDEVEREISRLRERLRRVGYIGEQAVEEFEREQERVTFLREQLTDVEGASASLRTMLAELRMTMNARFEHAFEQVAAAFSETFTELFGGGVARLVLVEQEHGAGPGVDIVAQPPGKRLQSLALLSGGERALTAAALLFAILKVNPSPFVLLDEVDAALDEANIVRFRDRLQALAAASQVIIITHNRGTIEVADTLYGVTMRDDGVSSVVSLRMADVATAV